MTLRRVSQAALGAFAAFVLCAALSLWITLGVKPPADSHANPWHHYEYLAEGFLQGHTYLSLKPAPELLRLADPFDPSANIRYRLWDASLYGGKYYLYYGPTPAIALMVPFRLLTGHALSQQAAVAVFACIGLAALIRLLWEVRTLHFPEVSPLTFGLLLVVTFHASWLPVILRRPGVWELPIVAADACLWTALYSLWRFHERGRRAFWAAATGVALGLLMGCRVTNVFGAAIVTVLLFVPEPGLGLNGIAWRRGALGAGLAAAAGLLLLAYNHARFGNWLEFGQTYQLWGMDERNTRHFDPAFIPFNARLYLTSVPFLSPYFPFIRGAWPEVPQGYIATEEIQGIIFAMPVHLLGFCSVVWLSKRRLLAATRPLAITLLAAASASILVAGVLFCFAGACSRYMTELVGGWTIVTAVGLMVAVTGAPFRKSRIVRAVLLGAGCWTVAATWLSSAEFRAFMKKTEPRVYFTAAHLLDRPSLWWIEHRAIRFGPLEMDIRIPSLPAVETVLVATGRPQMADQLILVPVDGAHVRLILCENDKQTLKTGPILVQGGHLQVTIAAPWLYPPPEHPYWDRFSAAEQNELKTLFSITAGPLTVSTHSPSLFDASALEPVILSTSQAPAWSPSIESIRRVERDR